MSHRRSPAGSVSRRQALVATAALMPALGWTQAPSGRPVRLITGFPGGILDFGARLVAPRLAEALGTSVIVETKAGATGIIASDYVAKAPGDGHTLLVATPTPLLVAPQAMPKPPFNALTDFKGINMIWRSPISVAVNPQLEVRTLKDLVALSHKRPVTMGTSGIGGTLHLVVESLAQAYGAKFQVVPYKSSTASATDAMAGHIDACVSDVGPYLPYQREGRLRLVAITSPTRLPQLPDLPTVQEDIPGFVMDNWLGLFAPGSTPPSVVDALNDALQKVLAQDQVRTQIERAAAIPTTMPSVAAFQTFLVAEHERAGKVIRDKGIVAAS